MQVHAIQNQRHRGPRLRPQLQQRKSQNQSDQILHSRIHFGQRYGLCMSANCRQQTAVRPPAQLTHFTAGRSTYSRTSHLQQTEYRAFRKCHQQIPQRLL